MIYPQIHRNNEDSEIETTYARNSNIQISLSVSNITEINIPLKGITEEGNKGTEKVICSVSDSSTDSNLEKGKRLNDKKTLELKSSVDMDALRTYAMIEGEIDKLLLVKY